MDSIIYYSFSGLITFFISIVSIKYLKNKKAFLFLVAILLWQLVVGLVADTGFYYDLTLPPKLVIAGIIPTFVLLGAFFLSKSSTTLQESIPKHIPIFFQSFRIIVELLILKIYLDGFGPIEATFQGYNYEFYFGFSALIIGILSLKGIIGKKIIVAWNVFGLGMLAFIVGIFFTTAFAHESFWGVKTEMVKEPFFYMPYLSIATFYMPVAVWMHIFSLKQHK